MKVIYAVLGVLLAAVSLPACKKQPPPEEPARIVPRTDFAPHEFGIGKPHTKNFACNREIDDYLEEIRKCYNTHNMEACADLQRTRTDKINRLKNAAHCAHGNAQK